MQEVWVGSLVGKIPWRRKWQLTPVFFPGKSHGQRSLVDYNPWGHKSQTWLEDKQQVSLLSYSVKQTFHGSRDLLWSPSQLDYLPDAGTKLNSKSITMAYSQEQQMKYLLCGPSNEYKHLANCWYSEMYIKTTLAPISLFLVIASASVTPLKEYGCQGMNYCLWANGTDQHKTWITERSLSKGCHHTAYGLDSNSVCVHF